MTVTEQLQPSDRLLPLHGNINYLPSTLSGGPHWDGDVLGSGVLASTNSPKDAQRGPVGRSSGLGTRPSAVAVDRMGGGGERGRQQTSFEDINPPKKGFLAKFLSLFKGSSPRQPGHAQNRSYAPGATGTAESFDLSGSGGGMGMPSSSSGYRKQGIRVIPGNGREAGEFGRHERYLSDASEIGVETQVIRSQDTLKKLVLCFYNTYSKVSILQNLYALANISATVN
jgi:hypothetical protein